MTKITKIILWVIALVILVIIVALVWLGLSFDKPTAGDRSNGTIKIGAILPLTGNLASLGESGKNGAILAFNDLNSKEKEKLEIIFEDDQFNPQNTVSAFNKLVDINEVDVVVCFTSGPCNAVAPIAEEKQVPMIAIASDNKIQKDKNFVVRLEIALSEESKKLLEYIKEKNYQKIASVTGIDEAIQTGYEFLKKDEFFEKLEIIKESVNPKERDFRTVIVKLLDKKPDLIFVGLLPGMAGEFTKQARLLKYQGNFIGFNFLEGEETLTAGGDSLEGFIYTNIQSAKDWFNNKYQEVYNKSAGPGAAHMFDAVKLIVEFQRDGIEKGNLKLAEYLNSIKDFNGALGIYSSNGQHEFTLPIILKMIKNGQFVPYKK